MTDAPKFTVAYVTRNNKVEIARFSGQLVGGENATRLHGHIHECIDKSIKLFCFNLSGIDWMNSTGLGMIISAHTSITNVHGQLILCHAPDNVMLVFENTRLRSVFTFCDTEEQALEALQKT